jgi:drug/metabolite transporter (DMT)-like permease
LETTKKYSPYLPFAAILLCCLIWGTTFSIVKNASTLINPYLLSILRNLIAVLILGSYLIIKRDFKPLLNKTSLLYGAVLGVLLGFIYVVQTIGLVYTSSNHSAFISCSAVIMAPVLMYFLGWQKFTKKQVISIGIVTVGLFYLTIKSTFGEVNKGDIITFIAAIICAFHLVYSGHYVRKVDFMGLIFYQFFFAFLASLIGLVINQSLQGFPIILFKNEAIFNVLYLGILGTTFCFFVTVWAQKYVSTVYTALIFSLEPLFASTTNYFVLAEGFTPREYFGASLILLGLIVYSVKFRKRVDLT